MKNILDYEDPPQLITYASRAFIYFKWMAVFFTTGLMASFFQVRWMLHPRTTGIVIASSWMIAFFLAFPCLSFAIRSFNKKEPLGYKNIVATIASVGMLFFFTFVIFENWVGFVQWARS